MIFFIISIYLEFSEIAQFRLINFFPRIFSRVAFTKFVEFLVQHFDILSFSKSLSTFRCEWCCSVSLLDISFHFTRNERSHLNWLTAFLNFVEYQKFVFISFSSVTRLSICWNLWTIWPTTHMRLHSQTHTIHVYLFSFSTLMLWIFFRRNFHSARHSIPPNVSIWKLHIMSIWRRFIMEISFPKTFENSHLICSRAHLFNINWYHHRSIWIICVISIHACIYCVYFVCCVFLMLLLSVSMYVCFWNRRVINFTREIVQNEMNWTERTEQNTATEHSKLYNRREKKKHVYVVCMYVYICCAELCYAHRIKRHRLACFVFIHNPIYVWTVLNGSWMVHTLTHSLTHARTAKTTATSHTLARSLSLACLIRSLLRFCYTRLQ